MFVDFQHCLREAACITTISCSLSRPSPAEAVPRRAVGPFVYLELLDPEFAHRLRLPVFFVCLLAHGHKVAHVSRFVWIMARVEPDSGATKTLCKTTVFFRFLAIVQF